MYSERLKIKIQNSQTDRQQSEDNITLPKIRSINLLHHQSQQVMQKMRERNKSLQQSKKLKPKPKLETRLKYHKISLNQEQFFESQLSTERKSTKHLPVVQMKIIPQEEQIVNKLAFDKFIYKDNIILKPFIKFQRKDKEKYEDSKFSSYNEKAMKLFQDKQMEKLKTVQQTVLYYLSQQTERLDHHFDQLEEQLSL